MEEWCCFGCLEITPGRCEFEDFEILNVLGQGFFGGKFTKKAKVKQALKIMNGQPSHAQKVVFNKEIKTIIALEKHVNVVEIYGFCTFTDPLSILMENMTIITEDEELSNLYMYLIYLRKKFQAGKWRDVLSNTELFKFVKQIARGMRFLERQKIVHGNLMTRNVLIGNCKILKISDFDFTKTKQSKDDDQKCLSKYISRRWAAPEVTSQKNQSNDTDVWSFGVVIWEIGTLGGFPFPSLTDNDFVEILQTERPWSEVKILYKEMIPENFSEDLFHITERCWFESEKRPNFDKLYNELEKTFPYQNAFKDFDFLNEGFKLAPTIDDFVEKKAMKTLEEIKNFQQKSKHLKSLGNGNFGQVDLVYSYEEILGHKTMVLKTIDIKNQELKVFLQEKKILEKIGEHENLVRILAFSWKDNEISIISEYVALNLKESGTAPTVVISNLQEYLLKLREDFKVKSVFKTSCGTPSRIVEPSLNHKHLGSFAFQIARGMAFLESQGICHGNLSPKNVQMSYYKTVKITDYGLRRTIFSKGNFSDEFRRRLAPEVLNNGGIGYSIKSDVWAFGILLWEIATLGAYPYGNSRRDLEAGSGKNFRPKKPEYDSQKKQTRTDKFPEIFDRCLNESPQKRPSFENLVEDLQNDYQIFYDFRKIPPQFVLPPTKEEVLRSSTTQYLEVSSRSSPSTLSINSSSTSAKVQHAIYEIPDLSKPTHKKFSTLNPTCKIPRSPNFTASASFTKVGSSKPSMKEIKYKNPPASENPNNLASALFSKPNPRVTFDSSVSGKLIKDKSINLNPKKVIASTDHTPTVSYVEKRGSLKSSVKEITYITKDALRVGRSHENVPRTNPNYFPTLCPYCGKDKIKRCLCLRKRDKC